MAAERILVVDDEPGVRDALEGILRDEGFEVLTADSGEAGLAALERQACDAVLLDIWLPGIDGLETLIRLRKTRVDAEVVMISGHGTIETAVRATKLGAFDFVEKPLSLEKTLLVLRNALRQRRLERRNRRLLEQLEHDTEVIGSSPAAESVRAGIAAASGSGAPVLIVGEKGTGRESVARRIHARSARSGEAFVDVSCGALDARAAVRTLFGEQGRAGRLALASRGSLFLADVERLDSAVQERLAAALQDEDTDVRLMASCSGNPSDLDQALLQQLVVFRISVAPLRERREDVPLLVERFMRALSREYGRPQKRLAPECRSALLAYDWPGNVREVRNVVERLLLTVGTDPVGLADLPVEMGGAKTPTEDLYREFSSLAEGLETFERYYVRRTLTEERGDIDAAASRLGVSPSTLAQRIKALRLVPPRA